MFKPPNLRRRAFLVHAAAQGVFNRCCGCSKISLSMKCACLPRAASSCANSRLLIWTLAVSVPRFKTSKRSRRDGGDVVIVEINDFFRVRDDGVGVAGQKIFALADADDERRTAPRADNRVRLVGANHREAVSADDFAQRVADGLGERVWNFVFVGDDVRSLRLFSARASSPRLLRFS